MALVIYPLELVRDICTGIASGAAPACPYCGTVLLREEPDGTGVRDAPAVFRCNPCRRAAFVRITPDSAGFGTVIHDLLEEPVRQVDQERHQRQLEHGKYDAKRNGDER
jgi:hypothetical protein